MKRLFFAGDDVLVLRGDDAPLLAEALNDAAYCAWVAGDQPRKDRLLALMRVVEDKPERVS